ERMARACLRTTSPPEQVADQLRSSAEGGPLLGGGLLAAWVGWGALVRTADGWAVRRYVAPVVPLTFADSVRRRFEGLDATGKQLLQAAAVARPRVRLTVPAA